MSPFNKGRPTTEPNIVTELVQLTAFSKTT